ncbi:hypothetical protein, partial [Streptococcus suis]|uniref:hypothetical protein n=1 Tax=Streptococcus suis TaxID=1307 RepID=UPI001BB20DE8
SISILEISVWASPDSLTSGSLVINELVALDLTNWENFLLPYSNSLPGYKSVPWLAFSFNSDCSVTIDVRLLEVKKKIP